MGGARAVEIAVALIRQKIIALLLGPAGYSVLSWIRNVCDLLTTLPLLGLHGSAIRFISAHARDGERDAIRRVVATTLAAALASVPLVVAVYFFFTRWHVAQAGLDPDEHLALLRVSLLSVPVMSAVAVFNAFLIGFKEIRRASSLIVATSVLTLIIGVPLTLFPALWGVAMPFWRLAGGLASGAGDGMAQRGSAALALSFLDAIREAGRQGPLYGLWGTVLGLIAVGAVSAGLYIYHFSRVFAVTLRGAALATARRMSGVAAGDWLGGTFSLLAFLIVRSHFIKYYSNEVNGLYNSIYVMCSLYLGPLAHSLIFYTYPRMSELRSREEIVSEINGTLRVVLLLSTPAMALMGTAVKPLLFILFTSTFVAAAPLMPFQMVGEWFRLPMRSLGMALLGQERLKPYIFFDLFFYAVMIAVTIAGSRAMSFEHQGRLMTVAPCVGYAVGAIAATIGYYVTARRAFGYRLGRDNRRLVLASLAILIASLFVSPSGAMEYPAAAGKLLLLALWAWLVVRPGEWSKALDIIRRRTTL